MTFRTTRHQEAHLVEFSSNLNGPPGYARGLPALHWFQVANCSNALLDTKGNRAISFSTQPAIDLSHAVSKSIRKCQVAGEKKAEAIEKATPGDTQHSLLHPARPITEGVGTDYAKPRGFARVRAPDHLIPKTPSRALSLSAAPEAESVLIVCAHERALCATLAALKDARGVRQINSTSEASARQTQSRETLPS